MDELEDLLMEYGIMKAVDESLVGKTAAELARRSAKQSTGRRACRAATDARPPHPDFIRCTHEPGVS